LERQFCNLIPANTIKEEFEDFLMEKFDHVKKMDEAEFMQIVINERSAAYHHFVR